MSYEQAKEDLRTIRTLEQQRDALVEALEKATKAFDAIAVALPSDEDSVIRQVPIYEIGERATDQIEEALRLARGESS